MQRAMPTLLSSEDSLNELYTDSRTDHLRREAASNNLQPCEVAVGKARQGGAIQEASPRDRALGGEREYAIVEVKDLSEGQHVSQIVLYIYDRECNVHLDPLCTSTCTYFFAIRLPCCSRGVSAFMDLQIRGIKPRGGGKRLLNLLSSRNIMFIL